MAPLNKGMIHFPDRMERNGLRSHHDTQKTCHLQLKNIFISGIFHLLFSDHCELWVTATMESEIVATEGRL